MLIQIEMSPNFPAVVASLDTMGRAVLKAADKGLDRGVKVAAQKVREEYLTGQSLRSRTGFLRKAVHGWLAGPLHGVVGVPDASAVEHYKWLLGDEQKTILPQRAQALTIPIGEALTAAGAARFESVLDAERQLGTNIFRPKGSSVLGYKKGKKGKFRPLFALVKSVFVQGSGALYDGVTDSLDDITGEMQSEVDKVMEAGS